MRYLTAALLCFFLCSCFAEKAPPPPPEPLPIKYFVHKIRYSGETLGGIAGWYTGSVSNWHEIAEHNPGLDVRRMRIGTEVKIPEDMMLRRSPLPKPEIGVESQVAESDEPAYPMGSLDNGAFSGADAEKDSPEETGKETGAGLPAIEHEASKEMGGALPTEEALADSKLRLLPKNASLSDAPEKKEHPQKTRQQLWDELLE